MDSRFKKWVHYNGGRVLSGMLVGVGFLFWIVARFAFEPPFVIGLIVGIFLVLAGIITGILEIRTPRGPRHTRHYKRRR